MPTIGEMKIAENCLGCKYINDNLDETYKYCTECNHKATGINRFPNHTNYTRFYTKRRFCSS